MRQQHVPELHSREWAVAERAALIPRMRSVCQDMPEGEFDALIDLLMHTRSEDFARQLRDR